MCLWVPRIYHRSSNIVTKVQKLGYEIEVRQVVHLCEGDSNFSRAIRRAFFFENSASFLSDALGSLSN
jgi:hypothetical protein